MIIIGYLTLKSVNNLLENSHKSPISPHSYHVERGGGKPKAVKINESRTGRHNLDKASFS